MPASTYRVLVLDDDEVMRDLLHALLTFEGHQVTTAASGPEALTALAADPAFTVVLTDLHMAGLEGEPLVAALQSAMPSGCLLIGMSATEASAEVGPHLDGFVLKPFDAALLTETLDAAERRRTAHNAPDPAPPASSPTPGTGQPAADVLDDAILQSLVRLVAPRQLRQLYDMTIGDIEKRHARMQASASAGDLPELQREAHAIKGACGMVGATELQSLGASLEAGTTINTVALDEIPAACLRLRRMLDVKLQSV